MPKQSKIIQLVRRETIHQQTGEVLTSDTEKVLRIPQEPEYIKLYLQDLSLLLDVPVGPQQLLMRLIRKLDYDGMITLTASSRERLAETLEIKQQSLSNYLFILCQKGILRNVARGEYEMNPNLIAKGSWGDICKRRSDFTLSVRYSADGTRSVETHIDDQGSLALKTEE